MQMVYAANMISTQDLIGQLLRVIKAEFHSIVIRVVLQAEKWFGIIQLKYILGLLMFQDGLK